MLNTN